MKRGRFLSLPASFLVSGGLVAAACLLPVAVDAAAQSSRVAQKAGPQTPNAWEMPGFQLDGLDGRRHRLDEWRGRVILLNFWASWCAPCQYEIRELIGYQSRLGDRGLQILGMGVDEARKLGNVARTLGINYPVLIADPEGSGRLMRQWGNRTGVVPYNVVIAPDGRIVYIRRGPLDRQAFETQVVPLLKPDRLP